MLSVQEITKDVLRREGGYVNDPDDPGGATNHGVTLGTLRALGLDLDGDGRVTAQDVLALSEEQAARIFVSEYFEKPGIARLPEMLQASVFDMYVNAGANAVRILQRLLCDMGIRVAIDGSIGPETAAGAHLAAKRAPDHLADAYGIARRNYYYALADARPSLRKFARRRDGGKGGWIKRAEVFVSRRFHLSDAQHSKRVEKWG